MVIGSAVMVYMEITSEASEGETSDVVKKIIGKLVLLAYFFFHFITDIFSFFSQLFTNS